MHIKTVSYRTQSNLAERANKMLVEMIGTYVGNVHKNCDKHLPQFAYAMRSAVHESTGKNPAELLLVRKPLTPFKRLKFSENQLN